MKKQKKQLLELAKQAYNSSEVCQQWKDKILEVCPEFKPTLKVGKWYKDGKYLVCYNENKSYGFDDARWTHNWIITKDWTELKPATDKEVEEALIKEAKKRGFKEGIRYKSVERVLHDGSISKSKNSEIKSLNCVIYETPIETSVLNCGEKAVFYNGKWAEIISEPVKKMTVSEICKELGYDVEIIKD